MDILNLILAIKEPTGMWASIIKWIFSGVGNYAVAIILLTLMIKFLMLPLDFYQKYITKVNTKKQAKIQPEVDKLNARYGHNKDLLNQKTMELYKRENYNIVGTCIGMLLNLVLSMVIFFTLFSGINKMQYYTIDQEFITLQNTYIEAVVENYEGNTDELYVTNEIGVTSFNWSKELSDTVKTAANNAVTAKYEEIKTSFLWIKNVWIPDSYKDVIPDYSGYLKITNQKNGNDEEKLVYNTVMSPLMNKYEGQWNGLLLLPVISIATTVLSTMIPTWMEKAKCKRRGTPFIAQQNNKTMLFIMPIILGIFTLLYSAVFGLYIVVGAIFGLITSPLTTLITELLEERADKKQLVKQSANTVSYSRKNVDITNNARIKTNEGNNKNTTNKNNSKK